MSRHARHNPGEEIQHDWHADAARKDNAPPIKTITYLRNGRHHRGAGTVVGRNKATGTTKVKPTRKDWHHIHVTDSEIAAGSEKPPCAPRRRVEGAVRHSSPPKPPEPPPSPRWKELVADVRIFEIDHAPLGWPAARMGLLTALADELEAAHAKLAQFLPL